jgi:hypothetical protein
MSVFLELFASAEETGQWQAALKAVQMMPKDPRDYDLFIRPSIQRVSIT